MPRTTSSPALHARRTQQAEWGRVWHSLPARTRNQFQSLAAQTPIHPRTGKPRMSAFLLYSALCTARANTGRQPLTAAPPAPEYPQMLPAHMALQAVSAEGKFSLQITSLPYESTVVVYAAAPRMALTRIAKDSDYRMIGYLPSLGKAPADITALYTSVFRSLLEGEKAGIKLVGVSEHGYVTQAISLESVTAAPALAQELAQTQHPQDTGETPPCVQDIAHRKQVQPASLRPAARTLRRRVHRKPRLLSKVKCVIIITERTHIRSPARTLNAHAPRRQVSLGAFAGRGLQTLLPNKNNP